MAISLETRKLQIIDTLVGLQDEQIIQLIELLLHRVDDFWDALDPEQKLRIDQAIQDIENGKGIPHESVIQDFRKKFSA